MKDESEIVKYCHYMEEVKTRIGLMRNIINSGWSLGQEYYDYELLCLQLRKILELIAFSSLIANKDKYSQAYQKYLYEWRANQLLTNLEKINPNFYPKPVMLPQQGVNGVKHFADIQEPYLTREEFTKLLDLCSNVLHIWNPYSPKPRIVDFGIPIPEWLTRIEALLKIHCIQLADNNVVWIIVMSDTDGKVHAYVAVSA